MIFFLTLSVVGFLLVAPACTPLNRASELLTESIDDERENAVQDFLRKHEY